MEKSGAYKYVLVTILIVVVSLGVFFQWEIWHLSSIINTQSKMIGEKLSDLSEMMEDVSSELSRTKNDINSQIVSLKNELKYPITLTDALGRTVTIAKEPKSVVSASPSITEIIFAIGAEDKLIGVDKFSDYPPKVKEMVKSGKLNIIGGFADIDVEKVISLKPDLVLITTGVQAPYVKKLSELGLTVVALKEETLGDILQSILLVGRLLNKFDNASELVSDIANRIALVNYKVNSYLKDNNLTKVKVYWEVWYNPTMTIGKNSFINWIIEAAGGVNVFGDVDKSYFVVSAEDVISRKPDIILAAIDIYSPITPSHWLSMVKSREGWSSMQVIKEGKIFAISGNVSNWFLRPGPRVVLAVEMLAEILYPRAFNISYLPNIINETSLALPEIMPE